MHTSIWFIYFSKIHGISATKRWIFLGNLPQFSPVSRWVLFIDSKMRANGGSVGRNKHAGKGVVEYSLFCASGKLFDNIWLTSASFPHPARHIADHVIICHFHSLKIPLIVSRG